MEPEEPLVPAALPEVPDAPEVELPASPSRWPQPVVTKTALNIAIASIDVVFDKAFIFIPFKEIRGI